MNPVLFKALEEELLAPDTRKNRTRLQAILAEDFIEFASSGGCYTRAEVVDALITEAPARRQLDNLQAKEIGPGIVLVTYHATRTDIRSGQVFASLRSSIWRHSAEGWQMVFHQGTSQP